MAYAITSACSSTPKLSTHKPFKSLFSCEKTVALVNDVFLAALVVTTAVLVVLASKGINLGVMNAIGTVSLKGAAIMLGVAGALVLTDAITLIVQMARQISRLSAINKKLRSGADPEKLKERLTQANEELKQAQASKDTLGDNLKQLESKIQQATEARETAEKQVEELKQEIQKLKNDDADSAKLNQQLTQANEELKKVQAEKNTLDSTLKQLESKVQQATEARETADKQVEELKQSIQQLNGILDTKTESADETAKKQLQQLTLDLQQAQKKIKLVDTIENIEKQLKEKREALADISHTLEVTEKTKNEFQLQRDQKQTEVEHLAANKITLEKTINALTEKKSKLSQELSELEERQAKEQEKLKQLQGKQKETENKIESHKTQLEKIQQQLETYTHSIKESEQKLKTLSERHQAEQDKHDQLSQACAALANNKEDLEKTLKDMNAQTELLKKNSVQAFNEAGQKAAAILTTANEQAVTIIETAKKEAEKVKEVLDKAEEKLNEQNQLIEANQSKIDSLNQEIKQQTQLKDQLKDQAVVMGKLLEQTQVLQSTADQLRQEIQGLEQQKKQLAEEMEKSQVLPQENQMEVEPTVKNEDLLEKIGILTTKIEELEQENQTLQEEIQKLQSHLSSLQELPEEEGDNPIVQQQVETKTPKGSPVKGKELAEENNKNLENAHYYQYDNVIYDLLKLNLRQYVPQIIKNGQEETMTYRKALVKAATGQECDKLKKLESSISTKYDDATKAKISDETRQLLITKFVASCDEMKRYLDAIAQKAKEGIVVDGKKVQKDIKMADLFQTPHQK